MAAVVYEVAFQHAPCRALVSTALRALSAFQLVSFFRSCFARPRTRIRCQRRPGLTLAATLQDDLADVLTSRLQGGVLTSEGLIDLSVLKC